MDELLRSPGWRQGPQAQVDEVGGAHNLQDGEGDERAFVRPGDSPLRLLLMMACWEGMILVWLAFYGHLISRTGRSRTGTRVRRALDRLTGFVLVGLGVRLAFDRRFA